jgi:7-cyano-7-deazaguanine tRNA-ribosyltransferase
MQYFISWTHSDPVYHKSIPGIGVLVSHPNVNRSWSIDDWPQQPSSLILDSGAYQYTRQKRTADPSAILERQLAMIGEADIPTRICHLDVPMMGTRSLAELDRRIMQNLSNAEWLIGQAPRIPSTIHLVGVIQGYSVERTYFVAQALADMGYTHFALGSLAGMVASSRDELLRRVEAALEAVGPNIHVLGVSSIAVMGELARMGIHSADSGTPMHEAWRGGIFYSRPLRRYKIDSPHFREWRRSYGFAELLAEPLPCDCPVCSEDSSQIIQPRGKQYINQRALHNCYHLAQELGQ